MSRASKGQALANALVPPAALHRTKPTTQAVADMERKGEKGMASTTPKRRNIRGSRFVIYLPPEMATELRKVCIDRERSLSRAMEEAVRSWLDTPHPEDP